MRTHSCFSGLRKPRIGEHPISTVTLPHSLRGSCGEYLALCDVISELKVQGRKRNGASGISMITLLDSTRSTTREKVIRNAEDMYREL